MNLLPENGQGPPLVTLTIVFTPGNGSVTVNGPLENRMLCYALLEMAREILARKGLQQPTTAPKITTLPPGARLG